MHLVQGGGLQQVLEFAQLPHAGASLLVKSSSSSGAPAGAVPAAAADCGGPAAARYDALWPSNPARPRLSSAASIVTDLPTFSPEELARLHDSLFCAEVRAAWTTRHPVLPFYTLGTTNYYDIAKDRVNRPYPKVAAASNPVIRAHFQWALDRIAGVLSAHLRAPVSFAPSLGLPGFHIFLSDPRWAGLADSRTSHKEWLARARANPALASSPIHVDTGHNIVDWGPESEAAGIDFSRPISFTVPVLLPRAGGGAGMNMWDLHRTEAEAMGQELYSDKVMALLADPAAVTPLCYNYTPGSLALHTGHYYHQARDMPHCDGDERITMQGHGLCVGGTWMLFW